ncbi:MAG TPA: winged helix-turn-helix domain-containing protein [Candidatus Saccharimonadales bacterium]|nr:winged helix-turn-helix domain-containing protein [Candidatus Saccharimonadales bacterium]
MDMTKADSGIHEFGDFRVDAGKRVLLRDSETVPLTPKVFDTLLHLVQNHGKTVEKEELMRTIWPDTIVEENNLSQNISTLRRVLGQNQADLRYIVTVPGKGYRFVADVRSQGQIVSATPTSQSSTRTTLAVLPFENLSANAEKDYLADGLTEETITALGQIDADHLNVIGRTSVMAYKRTIKTLHEIGKELGAAYLVESSLRSEGERIRITSKLIRASDQVQIWTASYDSEPSSMLVFERELSAAIAEQIRLRLSPERMLLLARRHTKNAEAYDLYLRGRHYWYQLTPPTTKRAIDYFTQATQLDREYALAWSGIADANSASPINGDAPSIPAWNRSKEAAAHAVAAEPNLAEAQTSWALVNFWFAWDWLAAESAHRKAIELDPNYHLAHRMLGIVLGHMGRHSEAQASVRRAREIDPLLAVHQALSAYLAFIAGDYSAALQFARQAIVVDPDFWIGHFQLGQVQLQLGHTELALESLNSAARLSGGNSKTFALRGYFFGKLGRVDKAMEILNTLEVISRERYVPPYALALIYAGLGQGDSAFEWLEKAYEVRDVHLIFLPVDPKWDSLRADGRFASLVKRCGFHTIGG